ncbi:hypothetical protein GCM10022212_00480 [Actimicrobium antarcticum]|uniref:HTH crp-type domain-containing protein n=2 Tax=Actimicrobium antarcticum TaxID=1051899 RepID=A0ABP7SGF7_9BURK
MGQVVQHPHQPVKTIWFPVDCLMSLRAVNESGAALEIAQAGNDSVIGLMGMGMGNVGTKNEPGLIAVVEIGGSAMQIDVVILKKILAHSFALQTVLYDALRDLMLQASRNALCTHYHFVEPRVARALLRMRDRMHMNKFQMTQGFLAQALGVRRAGVTKAASALQLQGLIRYSRGAITILDGAGLERAACACYATDRRLQTSSRQKLSE